MKHYLNILIVCLSFSVMFGQEEGGGGSGNAKRILPRTNIRASFNIPKIVANEAFRTSLSGVYDAQVSFNFRVAGNFNVGIGYKNAFFVINRDDQKLKVSVATRMQTHNAFVRLAYDKMFTEKKGFFSFVLSTGYTYNKYTFVQHKHDSLAGRYPDDFGAVFVRPEIGVNFLVEDNFSFGIVVAYDWTLSNFNPYYPAFNEYDDYSKYKNKVSMGYISFGFDFYIGLKRKPQ